jgi:hypothetical protein
VRVDRAQQLRVQHARQRDVVGVDRAPRDLRQAFELPAPLADDLERVAVRRRLPPTRPRRRREALFCWHLATLRDRHVGLRDAGVRAGAAGLRARAHRRTPGTPAVLRSRSSRAASSTASKIFV